MDNGFYYPPPETRVERFSTVEKYNELVTTLFSLEPDSDGWFLESVKYTNIDMDFVDGIATFKKVVRCADVA
jgi:hypothetical protein